MTRSLRAIALGITGVVVGALALPVAALGLGATGNPASIAFYRTAAARTNALPAYVQNQIGWVRIRDSVGRIDVSHWAWGYAQFKTNYYPTTEHIVLVQHGGRTVWLEDTLTPVVPPCHRTLCDKQYPIQFVVKTNAAYEGIVLKGATAACFTKESLNKLPYTVGSQWWYTAGHFSPEIKVGPFTEITSTYLNEGQHVTETDQIVTTTKRFAKSAMHAAAGNDHPAFTYHNTDVALAKVPKFPALPICS